MIHRFSFTGGINEAVDESQIKDNESPRAKNCDLSDLILRTCKGSELFYKPQENIKSMCVSFTNSKDLLMFSDSKMYSYLKQGLGYDKPIRNVMNGLFDSVNFTYDNKSITILTNGYDETFYYDGEKTEPLLNRGHCTRFETIQEPVINETTGEQLEDEWGLKVTKDKVVETKYIVDGNNNIIQEDSVQTTRSPKGKFIELHKERLWIAGDVDRKDRIYFSSAFDINDWTSPNAPEEANQHGGFIDIPSFDGGEVIGLKAVFDDLLIFKNKNIFKLFGSSPDNYEIDRLFTANGGIADKSIIVFENGCYFISEDGLYFFNGSQVENITHKIKNTWKRINKEKIKYSCAIKSGTKYILAVPIDGSLVNNFIIEYDTTSGSYMFKDNYDINGFSEFNNLILYSDNKNNINIYNVGECNSDLVYETKYYDLETPQARKEIEYVYFTASGKGSIKISLQTERKTNFKIIQLKDEQTRPYRVKLKNKGRLMKLKIENVDKSDFLLKELFVYLELDYD